MSKKETSKAAEKIVKAEKTKSKKSKSDKPNIFARMGKAISHFCKDFRGEIKKIVWPDLKSVLKGTGVVIAAIALSLAFIWLIDLGLSKSIDLLSDAARGANKEVNDVVDDTTTTTTALNDIVEDTTAIDNAETNEAVSNTEATE